MFEAFKESLVEARFLYIGLVNRFLYELFLVYVLVDRGILFEYVDKVEGLPFFMFLNITSALVVCYGVCSLIFTYLRKLKYLRDRVIVAERRLDKLGVLK